MATVLVNASAAKKGGAREILVRFLESILPDGNVYYVLCPAPHEFGDFSVNVKFIEFETRGIVTYFFSIFFVYYFCFRLRACLVFSFNNINCYYGSNSVTYFHQEKALRSKNLRFLLIRLGVRLGARGSFIVQSDRVKAQFVSVFKFRPDRVAVKWPGLRKLKCITPELAKKALLSRRFHFFEENVAQQKYAILPVYDPFSVHKDFSFFRNLKNILNKQGFLTISLCPPNSKVADYDLGLMSASDLDMLYAASDVMILISMQETLCLPLFEFARLGRPVLVRDAQYAADFKNKYPDWLRNVTLIPVDFEDDLVVKLIHDESIPLDCGMVDLMSKGNWDIINVGRSHA